MTTLFDASLALAKILGNVQSSTTTAAGSATTVVDSTRTEIADYWNKGTIWITSGTDNGKSRKITDWALSGTTFTVPTLTDAPGSGASYSVIHGDWPQDKLWEFINRALTEIGDIPNYDTTLTTVANQEEYTLPSGVLDVRNVEVAASTAAPYSYQPYHGVWSVTTAGKLKFRTGREPDTTGYTIRLTYVDEHAALTADSGVVSSYVHINRLIWSAAIHAWNWRIQMAKTDEPMYTAQLQFAIAQAEKFKARHPIPSMTRAVRLSL